jgi:hypothetical protein
MNFARFPDKYIFTSGKSHPWTLLLIVIFIYVNSWSNPFILDDFGHILQNPRIGSWENWQKIFTAPFFRIKAADLAQYYRPLVILTYKLEYLIFGRNPFGYHLVNTVFHCLNTCLVYLLCRAITREQKTAYLAALFFGIHPLQTEEVSYLSGLGGLAATSGMLIAVYFYFKFLAVRRFSIFLFSVLFFLIALLYKESALLLPVLLVWINLGPVIPRGGFTGKKHRAGKGWYLLTYFLFAGAYLFLRSFFLVRANFFSGLKDGFWIRFQTFAEGIWVYLRLTLLPFGLHFYRSLALVPTGGSMISLFTLGTLLVVLVLIFSRRGRLSPAVVIGSGWFIIGLLPFSGLNPIILESGFLYWGEHFMYFPLIGLAIFFSKPAGSVWRSFPAGSIFRRLVGWGVILIALNFALLTIRQNRYWSDEKTLFERMVRFEPQLFRTRGLLGAAYFKRGELGKAIEADSAARKILLLRSGRAREAKLSPLDKYQLRILLERMARAYGNLNRLSECRKTARELVELFPEYHGGYFILGQVMMSGGEKKEALSWLKKAYELNPRDFEIAFWLIRCYQELGDFSSGREIWKRSSRTIPAFRKARKILKNEEIRLSNDE